MDPDDAVYDSIGWPFQLDPSFEPQVGEWVVGARGLRTHKSSWGRERWALTYTPALLVRDVDQDLGPVGLRGPHRATASYPGSHARRRIRHPARRAR